MNMGKYATYEELDRHQREGIDYRVRIREGDSGIAIVAPHGGGIELGTMEIAREVAGIEHTFYGFEGTKATGNADLHITSKEFDEPRLDSIVRKVEIVLTVHGCEGEGEVVYVGGLQKAMKQKIQKALSDSGFRVRVSPKAMMGGESPRNICNRGRSGAGVQLEISKGLRKKMFFDLETHRGRNMKRDVFRKFVSVLRKQLSSAHKMML
jgi:phage replication-related protein YjqB (UPF0714/DUF867 family)